MPDNPWANHPLPFLVSIHSPDSPPCYPVLRYVFSDDDFAPAVDVLDAPPQEVSLLLDIDATGTRATALSAAWQVQSVARVEGAVPAWAAGEVANVLRVSGAPATSRVESEDVRELAKAFIERNKQLRQVVENTDGLLNE